MMTDDELAEWTGLKGKLGCDKFIAALTPKQRAIYERMREVEIELKLWAEGVGPKPKGVIACREHKHRRRR